MNLEQILQFDEYLVSLMHLGLYSVHIPATNFRLQRYDILEKKSIFSTKRLRTIQARQHLNTDNIRLSCNMMILSDFRNVVAFFDCDVLAHQARENLFCWKGFKLLSKKFDTKSIMISQQLARTLKHQIKHTLSLPSFF